MAVGLTKWCKFPSPSKWTDIFQQYFQEFILRLFFSPKKVQMDFLSTSAKSIRMPDNHKQKIIGTMQNRYEHFIISEFRCGHCWYVAKTSSTFVIHIYCFISFANTNTNNTYFIIAIKLDFCIIFKFICHHVYLQLNFVAA